ncbi:uncharacterized protein TNCV_3479951 [Trichonephila clavipes]|nr:uncharacterized protein TNCV_3479951 [Trichonephila clavipes]
MCKADVRRGMRDELAVRLTLSKPKEIYKDSLETDNKSSISSEYNFEIDLPGKRDRSTIYRLNLIKLYRRKSESSGLVMENSSEEMVKDSEILYLILKWLEQIDVSRMVDVDILMQIWKDRVKQIDFVLKWLSRVGSEVRPTKGEGVVTSSIVVNPHPSILAQFYGFHQMLIDKCTWPWDHCLLFELGQAPTSRMAVIMGKREPAPH